MRTKKGLVVLILALSMLSVIFFLTTGCEQKKLSPGGLLVNSFFKNWEFKRYAQMHSQTVNSREEDIFVNALAKTPIEWKKFSIIDEKQVGEDWEVTVSMEVTDVKSSFAACMVNLKYDPRTGPGPRKFLASPALLGIQQYMPIKQTWRVVNLDGKYFIDVCAAGSKKQRHENVMNYFLDTSDIIVFPSKDKFLSASFWLAEVMMDLNIPEAEANAIIKESRHLGDKAEQNIMKLLSKIDSL
jgi:hypothetical protein